MTEFVSIFNNDDMTRATWLKLQERLKQEIKIETKSDTRYKNQGKHFLYSENQEFKGIINYLKAISSGRIENEISITAFAVTNNNEKYQPFNVTLFEDQNKIYSSGNNKNSWLCIYFKKYSVIPASYTIKTCQSWYSSCNHLKNFVLECSNDNSSWDVLDEEKDCSYLKGCEICHTFNIQNQSSKSYKYIRIRSTGVDWNNYNYLIIDSLEIYGTII